MAGKLEKLDSIYQNSISKLPDVERIDYCEKLIDKVQLSLLRNRGILSKTISAQLTTIMMAAQEEIKILSKTQL